MEEILFLMVGGAVGLALLGCIALVIALIIETRKESQK